LGRSGMGRGKLQSLYRYPPYGIFYHSATRLYHRVDRYSTRGEQANLNKKRLITEWRRLTAEFGDIEAYRPPKDPDEINVIVFSDIKTSIFPLTMRCSRCGAVRLLNRSSEVPSLIRFLSTSSNHCVNPVCKGGKWGQLQFVSLHTCGEIDSLRPTSDILHPSNSLIFYDTRGSNQLEFHSWLNKNTGKDKGIFSTHNCAHTPTFRTATTSYGHLARVKPLDESTVTMPQVLRLINAVETMENAVEAIPGSNHFLTALTLGLCPEWNGSMHLSEFIKQLANPSSAIKRKDMVSTQELLDLALQLQQYNPTSELKLKIESYQNRLKELATTNHPDINTILKKLMRIEVLENEHVFHEHQEYMSLFEANRAISIAELRNQAHDSEVLSNLDSALQIMNEIELKNIWLIEDIKLSSILIGYARGSYDWADLRFCDYYESESKKHEAYVHTVPTEGILVQFNPTKVLSYLNKCYPQYNIPPLKNDFSYDLAYLKQNFNLDQRVPFEGYPRGSFEASIFEILHTFSHLLLRSLAQVTGLDINSTSERIYPLDLAILVYDNHSTEFTLGGLSTAFELDLNRVLSYARELANDCLYEPICSSQVPAACHECLYISEVSCSNFNRNLDRLALIGSQQLPRLGFWSM